MTDLGFFLLYGQTGLRVVHVMLHTQTGVYHPIRTGSCETSILALDCYHYLSNHYEHIGIMNMLNTTAE